MMWYFLLEVMKHSTIVKQLDNPTNKMKTTELYTSNEQTVRYACDFCLSKAVINKERGVGGVEKWAESLPLRKE